MATYFQGAVKSGDNFSELPSGVGVGTAVFTQTVTLQAATAANVDASFLIPKGARILGFNADSSVAWTATTASLTVGQSAGGTEYVTGFDVKTITRGPTAAYTAAQLGAMDNVGANTTVYVRVASTGANATGTTKVTIQYTGGSF
jgi:hypothetical protein